MRGVCRTTCIFLFYLHFACIVLELKPLLHFFFPSLHIHVYTIFNRRGNIRGQSGNNIIREKKKVQILFFSEGGPFKNRNGLKHSSFLYELVDEFLKFIWAFFFFPLPAIARVNSTGMLRENISPPPLFQRKKREVTNKNQKKKKDFFVFFFMVLQHHLPSLPSIRKTTHTTQIYNITCNLFI